MTVFGMQARGAELFLVCVLRIGLGIQLIWLQSWSQYERQESTDEPCQWHKLLDIFITEKKGNILQREVDDINRASEVEW